MHASLEEYASFYINNMFIVGDLFMQKYYTIFDRDQNRIGMAKAHHNS